MPPVGFETTIWAGERPQNYALERADFYFEEGQMLKGCDYKVLLLKKYNK